MSDYYNLILRFDERERRWHRVILGMGPQFPDHILMSDAAAMKCWCVMITCPLDSPHLPDVSISSEELGILSLEDLKQITSLLFSNTLPIPDQDQFQKNMVANVILFISRQKHVIPPHKEVS